MILVVQFMGAIVVIRPSLPQLLLCMGTLGGGLGLFAFLARLQRTDTAV